jgi:hypothetical protein
MIQDQNQQGGGLPNNHLSDKQTMLTRPQQRYVEENLIHASRKSMTPRMYTTKLMSGKMTKLLMVVTIVTRRDCSRT